MKVQTAARIRAKSRGLFKTLSAQHSSEFLGMWQCDQQRAGKQVDSQMQDEARRQAARAPSGGRLG